MKNCKAGFLILQVILLATLIEVTTAGTQCKDENGKEVDWFIVYKLPSGAATSLTKPGLTTGEIFYFMDSNRYQKWTLSEKSIKDTKQPLSTTLQQVYMQPTVMHLMYNDHPPDEKSNQYFAHAKGVVAFDNNSGFWLIHSVPQFPPKNTKNAGYQYPQSATKFGQAFLCVSFNTTPYLLNIVRQMRVNRVQIYDRNITEIFSKDMNAELKKLINNSPIDFPMNSKSSRIQTLSSIGGKSFESFAKTDSFGKDLYDALVAPILKSDLAVESWKRINQLPNSGKTYKVYNVDAVELPVKTSKQSNSYFRITQDHSKFAVSAFPSNNWVCIGDINRAESQTGRGGGTLCFEHQQVADAFRNAIYFNTSDEPLRTKPKIVESPVESLRPKKIRKTKA